jgi:lipoprotein NlpI
MRTFLAAALAAAVVAAACGDEKDDEAKKLLAQIEEKAKAAGAAKDDAERNKLYDEMIDLAKKAEKLDDKNPAVPFALGTAHAAKREHKEAVEAFKRAAKLAPEVPVVHDRLGDAYLKSGQFGKAVESFDEFLKKVKPEDRDAAKKHHWRRGIALYFDGKYDEGAKQFEIHHEVNKEDVENSVWNYACLLRRDLAAGKKTDEAKPTAAKGLFDAKSDGREPLQAVLETYKNVKEDKTKAITDAIDKFKKDAKAAAEDKKEAEFYGHLYIALYYDAEKNHDACKKHLEMAVGKDKAEREKKAISHYMWDVAVAHLDHFDELKKRP